MTDQTHFADDATLARIAALEAELVSYTLERTMRQHAEKTNDDLLAQLAASQARIKELRVALEYADQELVTFLPGEGKQFYKSSQIGRALSTTDNDEALRKYVAGEMRKMAGSAFSHEYHTETRWMISHHADRYEKGEV